MAIQPNKHLINVSEYYQLDRDYLFSKKKRVELIEGEIVEMTPMGSRHAAVVTRVMDRFLPLQASQKALTRIQLPICLSVYSEPEPDITLVNYQSDFYREGHPQPKNIYLIVEVSDTSIFQDRHVKLPLYAQYAISEVWLIDLNENVIETYREPFFQRYQIKKEYRTDQTLSPQAFPDLTIDVNDLL